MKIASVSLIALASSVVLATSACSKSEDTATTTSDTATVAAVETASADTSAGTPGGSATPAGGDHASQFLTNAIQANNAEIAAGQAAAKMGSTAAVKDYGKMLVADHTKANDEAKMLAQSMNVTVPTGTTPEAQTELKMATGMSGTAFDKDFAAMMVKDHQKAIDMFQQEASSSDAAPVVAFAKKNLPTLKKHLETAQSLAK